MRSLPRLVHLSVHLLTCSRRARSHGRAVLLDEPPPRRSQSKIVSYAILRCISSASGSREALGCAVRACGSSTRCARARFSTRDVDDRAFPTSASSASPPSPSRAHSRILRARTLLSDDRRGHTPSSRPRNKARSARTPSRAFPRFPSRALATPSRAFFLFSLRRTGHPDKYQHHRACCRTRATRSSSPCAASPRCAPLLLLLLPPIRRAGLERRLLLPLATGSSARLRSLLPSPP